MTKRAFDLHSSLAAELLVAAALALTCLLYWAGLHGGYVFDDYPNIVDNPAVHVQESSPEHWLGAALASPSDKLKRPLAMLSFAINIYAGGLNPFWLKLTNLLLHLLCGLLLFAVLRKLLQLWLYNTAYTDPPLTIRQADLLAAAVAAAWLVAPINLTAVLYVVQRMTSLAQVFVLAGLWCYLHGRERQFAGLRRGWLWILGGLAAGVALGLGGKETAVMLPSYALVCELTLLGFRIRHDRRSPALIVLFVVLTAIPAYIVLTWLLPSALHGGYAHRPFTLGQRLLTETRVLVDYIQWTLLPSPNALSFYHDDIALSHGWLQPPATAACAALLAALLVAALACLRRAPLVALGLLWFFAGHALTATIVPLELVFEHRNYFASAGLLLAAIALLFRLANKEPLGLPAGMLVIALIAWPAAVTAMRALDWSNPVRLASSEALIHPHSPRAQYELGRILVQVSDYGDRSSDLLTKAQAAMARAMRLNNASILPEQGLIMVAGHRNEPADPVWWRSMADKLARHPPSAEDIGAIHKLVICQIQGPCPRTTRPMLHVFVNALGHPHPDARLLANYAQFAYFELHDKPLARRMAQQAIAKGGVQAANIREALGPVLRGTQHQRTLPLEQR